MTTITAPLPQGPQTELTPLRHLMPNALLEAAIALDLSALDTERLLDAAQSQLHEFVPRDQDAELELAGPGYAVVLPPESRKFNPRVVQFKLSPLIACTCGAIGTVLGGLTPVGWALIGAVAAIGLRDFWSRKVIFKAEHGQVLFEMFRSTDSGKPHEIEKEHLFSNIQNSRAEARLGAMERGTFETTLATLLATGALAHGQREGTLRWTELAMEFDL